MNKMLKPSDLHRYSTSGMKENLPKILTTYGKFSFSSMAASMWNRLPGEILTNGNYGTFIRHCISFKTV